MALDLSTLKVGDEIVWPSSGVKARVTAIGELGVCYRYEPDNTAEDEYYTGAHTAWTKVPLIDPDQVWYRVDASGDLAQCHGHADGTCRSTDPHFRITATEPVT